MPGNLTSSEATAASAAQAAQYNDLRDDLIKNAGDYATAGGSANAFTLSVTSDLPTLAAGAMAKFKANHTITGAATLNINSGGAVTLKKWKGGVLSDLEANDIVNGAVIVVLHDGTYFQVIGGIQGSAVAFSLTAGEALAIRDAVALASSVVAVRTFTVTGADDTNRSLGSSGDAQYKRAQKIRGDGLAYNTVSVYMEKSGGPSQAVTVSIEASSGGNPSGTPLASATLAAGAITNAIDNIFTLDTSVTLTNLADYFIVISVSSLSTDYYNLRSNSGDPYANGDMTSYNGSTWSGTAAHDLRCALKFNTVVGKVYKADSDIASLATGFVGFAYAAVAAEASAGIQPGGVLGGFTGLTVGSVYYVNATAGSIGTSAGSTSQKVGKAISTTELLILVDI